MYTHWHRGKTEKGRSPEYFRIFEKNTIFNEHLLFLIRNMSLAKIESKMMEETSSKLDKLEDNTSSNTTTSSHISIIGAQLNKSSSSAVWNFQDFYFFCPYIRISVRPPNEIFNLAKAFNSPKKFSMNFNGFHDWWSFNCRLHVFFNVQKSTQIHSNLNV